MLLTLHRGCHEIGGSCVELSASGSRVILDLGMPLVAPWDKAAKLESAAFLRAGREELLAKGILPAVSGLYAGDPAPPPDAVLLSHPHQDHYGLLGHIKKDVPVFLSDGARRILAVSDLFLPLKAGLGRHRIVEDEVRVKAGGFAVTPYLVDHSAYGAMAFHVEAGGRALFYSGDFRGHGRKAGLFKRMLRKPPRPVHRLLMEGTTLGRDGSKFKTEAELEREFAALARDFGGPKLVACSGQNIDRLVTLYRAALRSRGVFVVDLYTALALEGLERPSLPVPSPAFANLKVLFTKAHMRKLYRMGRRDVVRRLRPFEYRGGDPRVTFLLYRESSRPEIEALGALSGGAFVWSLYEGYLAEDSSAATRGFIERHGLPLLKIHTSGHASPEDLARFVRALSPDVLTPIHTFHPGRYAALWPRVEPLADGDSVPV